MGSLAANRTHNPLRLWFSAASARADLVKVQRQQKHQNVKKLWIKSMKSTKTEDTKKTPNPNSDSKSKWEPAMSNCYPMTDSSHEKTLKLLTVPDFQNIFDVQGLEKELTYNPKEKPSFLDSLEKTLKNMATFQLSYFYRNHINESSYQYFLYNDVDLIQLQASGPCSAYIICVT